MLNNIISDRSSLDLRDFPTVAQVLNSLTQEEVKELLNILNNMQQDKLYKGLVHGSYHSEKVLMFCYLIARERNLREPYRQILFDAAMYHDIGRDNNSENTTHGMTSSLRIAPVIEGNPLYDEKYHVLLLKSAMSAHSRRSSDEKSTYEDVAYDMDLLDANFGLTPALEMYQVAYNEIVRILKDADALDRKRFGDAGFEALNINMLRFKESVNLVQFAEELNGLYYELMKLNYAEVNEEHIKPAPCVHSVGFDFFKINSVLTHGILSQEEMKRRQLQVPRNFAGGNFDRWISVVDIRLLKIKATASKEFIDHGVSFICENVKMHEPSSEADREDAIVTGMPWNKSNHDDERYVKNRIAPEKIVAINIPTNYINRSILGTARTGIPEYDCARMIYIYNSLDIKMIKQRVKYYKDKTQTSDDSPYWQLIEQAVASYEVVLNEREKYGHQKIAGQLNPILEEINNNIGKMLYAYYYRKIGNGGKDITVLDVVNYELSLNYSIDYDMCQTADGMTYFLRESTKSIEAKQM